MSRRDDEWDEAKLAIQETGAWVRHTDTKAAVLAAGVGVIVAAVLSQADDIASTYAHGVAEAITASALIGATSICLIVTLRYFVNVG